MKTDLTFIKPLIQSILNDKNRKNWTVQGFGFLRTYFGPPDNPKKMRLNLWDSQFTVHNVSTIHDHPWDFKSLIVAGEFINQRYDLDIQLVERHPTHTCGIIRTGEQSNLKIQNAKHVALIPKIEEFYKPGDTYSQLANEIHETKFEDGSITLNERIGDTEQARVFWPYGTDWVDAKPRQASNYEVHLAIDKALAKWF